MATRNYESTMISMAYNKIKSEVRFFVEVPPNYEEDVTTSSSYIVTYNQCIINENS